MNDDRQPSIGHCGHRVDSNSSCFYRRHERSILSFLLLLPLLVIWLKKRLSSNGSATLVAPLLRTTDCTGFAQRTVRSQEKRSTFANGKMLIRNPYFPHTCQFPLFFCYSRFQKVSRQPKLVVGYITTRPRWRTRALKMNGRHRQASVCMSAEKSGKTSSKVDRWSASTTKQIESVKMLPFSCYFICSWSHSPSEVCVTI